MELAAVDDVTFNSVSAVDGSFTGTLDTEVGGSNRIFNVGSYGDADTEYLEINAAGNEFLMGVKETGSGTLRNFRIGSLTTGNLTLQSGGESQLKYGSTTKLAWGSSYIYTQANFYPGSTNAYSCGRTNNRWNGVYGVAGDFSGDVVMAANVDFTGLPTSDPVVAGRLWNHNDTVKISAG